MEDDVIARHVSGLNTSAIGINSVYGVEAANLSKYTINYIWIIISYIKHKYHSLKYIIIRRECTLFRDANIYLEKAQSYSAQKSNSGDEFMPVAPEESISFGY